MATEPGPLVGPIAGWLSPRHAHVEAERLWAGDLWHRIQALGLPRPDTLPATWILAASDG